MEKKFELTDEFIINDLGIKLYRIKALKDFSDVKKGDFGGYIQRERNLSQLGKAWIYDNAKVFNEACVYGDACVYGNTRFFGYVTESGE